jgi:hypothetical protein
MFCVQELFSLSNIVPFVKKKKLERYFTAGQATDENMAHEHGMLDT